MFYTTEQLLKLGLKSFGDNVLISDKASIYGAENIEIGSNVRIDDFCILSAGSGGIRIGNYIHIACYAHLIGAGTITLEDHAQISGKVSIYSSSDDFTGNYLVGPTVPIAYTNVKNADVYLSKYVVIGCNTVILPGVHIGEGTAVGALSLVSKNLEPYKLYAGSPIRILKNRADAMKNFKI